MKESKLVLGDGISIQQYFAHIDRPKAHLLFVHGYAEHAGRYDAFANTLNDKGISFTSFDHRGHGKSDGLSAYIKKFDDLVRDLTEVVNASLKFEEPTFIMGHSMGGLVSLLYLAQAQDQFSGFICSSAALELDPEMSPLLQKLAPLLGAIFPKLPTQTLDITYLTRSPENLKNYTEDPLIYRKGTRARTGAEMIRAIKKAPEFFDKLSLPLLVLHGESDRLTMPGGSKKFYDQAIASDKELTLYPGLYHELIFEPEGAEIQETLIQWITERS